MNPVDQQKHTDWLHHKDIRALLMSNNLSDPWFQAIRWIKSAEQTLTWYSALVPPSLIPKFVNDPGSWDTVIGDVYPAIWTGLVGDRETDSYTPFGKTNGIEPLVIYRDFNGIRDNFIELAQEFRLYHNLYPESSKKRLLFIDNNGDESEAARYGANFLEIRTDLVLKCCAVKRMALAIYVDCFRNSEHTLEELNLEDLHKNDNNAQYAYSLIVTPDDIFKNDFETIDHLIGKKYILPVQMSDQNDKEAYQDFIIGTDEGNNPVRHTCDPEKLANYFGKNAGAPHYLTPVLFRSDVLAKYYADPDKYSVEDGYLRCGDLWGLRMDNDHPEHIVVFLGDLGRDLSEKERNYWLSFNILPEGKAISETAYRRGFLGQFAGVKKADLRLKHEYTHFNLKFREKYGWDFFLPLHEDDKHFLISLHLLSRDNQSEFDSQLIALTKVLVDSLNESKISEGLTTVATSDKGITKLEKLLKQRKVAGDEPHVRFLRVLQDFRSKSAAHRKGSNYDELIVELKLADDGQQRVCEALFVAATELIQYLRNVFVPEQTQ